MEDTITFSSTATLGSCATSEPVAMQIALVSNVCLEPSAAVTSTWPAPRTVPIPVKVSTLFFLNRNWMPCTLEATESLLCFIIALRSSLGLPMLMPSAGKSWVASSNRSEACSSALEGMHPTLRQVPPKVARFSTTATLRPSCAARIAQT